jgi:hypothetical protein
MPSAGGGTPAEAKQESCFYGLSTIYSKTMIIKVWNSFVAASVINIVVASPLVQQTNSLPAPITVPEKVMSARLLTYATPNLSKPPSTNRCSNALAVVKVFVDESGKVSGTEYLSGYEELKEPALAAVKQWSYKPYLVDGHPVAVETQASIFYLGDGESLPMYLPDGKGKVKGGNVLPLPAGCGSGPRIKRDS